jgi:hypothetical protein
MRIPFTRIKVFPVLAILWVIVIYFLVNGITDWRMWLPLSLIIFERLVMQYIIWLSERIQKRIAEQLRQQVEEALRHGRA